MCGITGFWGPGFRAEEAEQILGRMTDAIRHRGPDDAGTWTDPEQGVALGHRRLSILDLTPTGHQPMASRDGRYVIVFNGEIYNFAELRQRLAGAGARFRGTSDTEIMLAAISSWGLEAAVKAFAGQFAFALWDRETRQLHLVRDRLGEKPLYYGWMGNTLLFGSELKALRAHPSWHGSVDRNALTLYMRHGCVPAPYSIYEGVQKVEPASIVTLSSGGRSESVRYWVLEEVIRHGLEHPLTGGATDILDQVERELRNAIGQQMVADVPIGAFLSGGVDSSAIVALMQAQSTRPVRTFTIGFHNGAYDEATHARAVAAHLGTEHTELYISPEEARAVIPLLPRMFDEPFADSSQIPTFLVAQLARHQVTVALSGDGGDELFGGYYRYFIGDRLWRGLAPLPAWLRRIGASAAMAPSPSTWDRIAGGIQSVLPGVKRTPRIGERIHKLATVAAATDAPDFYRAMVSYWQHPADVVLGGHEPASVLTKDRALVESLSTVEQMMYFDARSYLPDDILAKVDRATMAVSLESRAPLLDHRVVELGWQVPMSMKVRDGVGKIALREVLYRHVPKAMIERPKMGFSVPISEWLRGPLSEWVGDLLSERRIRDAGFFEPRVIGRAWQEHRTGSRNWEEPLWAALMFEAWREAS
jgi:asparagine synthase (glutamine-hydrolysing)